MNRPAVYRKLTRFTICIVPPSSIPQQQQATLQHSIQVPFRNNSGQSQLVDKASQLVSQSVSQLVTDDRFPKNWRRAVNSSSQVNESVNKGAHHKLHDLDWSAYHKAARIIFYGWWALLHFDKKVLIQNVKTFSSGTNAQTVWLGVYKYSDWEKNILSKRFF